MSRDVDFEASSVPTSLPRTVRPLLGDRQRNRLVSLNHRFKIERCGVCRVLKGFRFRVSINMETLQRGAVCVERITVPFDEDIYVKFECSAPLGCHVYASLAPKP